MADDILKDGIDTAKQKGQARDLLGVATLKALIVIAEAMPAEQNPVMHRCHIDNLKNVLRNCSDALLMDELPESESETDTD